MAHANSPSNAANLTCKSNANEPDTQFTCVTSNLLAKRGKFACVYAANSTCKIRAKCLRPWINLLEVAGKSQANLNTELVRICHYNACKTTPTASYKAGKWRIVSPAGYGPPYLQYAGEYTHSEIIAVLTTVGIFNHKLQVFLRIARKKCIIMNVLCVVCLQRRRSWNYLFL